MRIGIDARLYGKRGLGRYVEKLLEQLGEIDTQNEYFVFLDKDGLKQYNPRGSNFYKVLSPYRCYSFQEQTIFAKQLYSYSLDLMHFTHFNVPLLYRRPFVVTIHDLILLEYPTVRATTLAPLFYKFKYFVFKKVIASAIKRSLAVFAISLYTKNSIIKNFKVKPEKIIVTYNGCTFFDKHKQNIGAKSVGVPYFLYTGSAYPHKNLEKLVEAFSILIQQSNKKFHLVLVGGDDYFYKCLQEYINKNIATEISERIHLLGFVDDEMMPALYKNAHAFVLPSLYEGFGLPPLEAMAYNIPVVSSNATCLPEILGDSALFCNASDVNELADALALISEDDNLRAKLILRGQGCIKQYTWQALAKQTFNTYISILTS